MLATPEPESLPVSATETGELVALLQESRETGRRFWRNRREMPQRRAKRG